MWKFWFFADSSFNQILILLWNQDRNNSILTSPFNNLFYFLIFCNIFVLSGLALIKVSNFIFTYLTLLYTAFFNEKLKNLPIFQLLDQSYIYSLNWSSFSKQYTTMRRIFVSFQCQSSHTIRITIMLPS